VAWLEERLFHGDLSLDRSRASPEELMETLRRGQRRDFRDGDVVVLDGWYFARTEARLLALISLRWA
jgi:hypothetical protein